MFKKFIIYLLAISGLSMFVRDLLTVISVKRPNKSNFAKFYLYGTLMRTYADRDFIESGMTEEEIENVKIIHRSYGQMK